MTPEAMDLKALTARAAERWPDNLGLTSDETGERLTFRDIETRSNRIANVLRDAGVAPGDRVAVMLRNRVEFPLTWIAISKAGATMVPLNVFYKTADAGYLLEHSEACAIVTTDEFVPLIASIDASSHRLHTIFSLDGDGQGRAAHMAPLLGKASEAPPPVRVLAEQLANIQYTSGTTGRPKGCMLSNAYWAIIAHKVAASQRVLGPGDVMLTAQPFYYMDPQWNVAASLYSGAELVFLDRFHPSSLWDRIRAHNCTFFYCLGVMPRLLLNQPPDARDRDHKLPYVLCSAIPPKEHARIEERWGVPWYEMFGMTETGCDLVVYPEDHDAALGSGCIGRPAEGREARVVDDADRPLPRGEVGELALRGTGLMSGYFKNPEATAEALRNGWMHTGDLVRMDEAGLVYYVGRKKDMIRRSGENISAAEVEGVLNEHSKVRLSACIPVPDDLRGEEVKAYVVPVEGMAADDLPPAELIAYCEQRLAYFKVPRYWAYRDDLPRTPSERVEKGTLRREQDDPRPGAYDRIDDLWR